MALGRQLGERRARKRAQYSQAVEQPREIVGTGPRIADTEVANRKMTV